MSFTVKSAYDLWRKLLKNSKSPHTVRKYSLYLKPVIDRLGFFKLEELAEKKRYVLGLALSRYATPAARRNFYASWNSFRKFVEEHLEFPLFDLPKDFVGRVEKKEPRPLKETHFQALLKAVKELPDVETEREKNVSLKIAFYLMAFGGLRLGEALKVEREDIYFKVSPSGREYAEVRVRGKGRKERRVPIFVEETVSYLKEHLDDLPASLSPRSVEARLKRLYRKAVVEMGETPERFFPHRLRDTYLTRLADKGVDIRVLQELAGHSSIEMTRRYVSVSREKILEEVERNS